MNHQDIADRFKALETEKSAAYSAELARIERECQSLVELCGGIGHVYVASKLVWLPIGGGTTPAAPRRACCVCGRVEP